MYVLILYRTFLECTELRLPDCCKHSFVVVVCISWSFIASSLKDLFVCSAYLVSPGEETTSCEKEIL